MAGNDSRTVRDRVQTQELASHGAKRAATGNARPGSADPTALPTEVIPVRPEPGTVSLERLITAHTPPSVRLPLSLTGRPRHKGNDPTDKETPRATPGKHVRGERGKSE